MKKLIIGLSLSAALLIPTSFVSAAEKGQLTNEQKKVLETKTEYVQSLPNTNVKAQSNDFSVQGAKRLTISRGSWLAWSKDFVDWYYSGGKVTSSSGDQDSGYVFPNIVQEDGITNTLKGTYLHKWSASKTLKLGSPTPWGDIVFVSNSYTDRVWVDGYGEYGDD